MRFLSLIGAAIAVAGIGFVAHRLFLHADEIRALSLSWTSLAILGLASVLSGALGTFLALSWRRIVAHLGGTLTSAQALHIYGVSQIGKYIPGNIFHFAGRQAMGQQAGLPAGVVLKSAIWEIGLIAVVSILFVLLALPGYMQFPAWIGVVLFLIGAAAAGVAIWIVLDRHILLGALLHLAYLLGLGVTFVVSLSVLVHIQSSTIPVVVGAFVVSWLVGLLTPGAPAGIGVRELALYVMLAGTVDQALIAPAVVLGRLVNVVGDVLFFLAAQTLRSR